MSAISRQLSLFSVVAVAFISMAIARPVMADEYKVDPVHSSVIFRAQHVNAGYVFGWFKSFTGTVTTDDDASKMTFEVTAKVESIDTNNEKRDTHLKSPDFFAAGEFPTVTFKSTAVKSAGENKYEVTGDLTMHGQTKSETITIEKTGASKSDQMGDRVGFLTTFTIKRTDFGMSKMVGMVSDDIQLTVALEGVKGK